MPHVWPIEMIELSRAQKELLRAIADLPVVDRRSKHALACAMGPTTRIQQPSLNRIEDLELAARVEGTWYVTERGIEWLKRFAPRKGTRDG